jgi:hypothetical protein
MEDDMSELETKNEAEADADAREFTEELSDEALDRTEDGTNRFSSVCRCGTAKRA